MNSKTAKYLRKLVGYDRKEPVEYKGLDSQDKNGNPLVIGSTNVCTGKRADYRILKRYFKGEDVILPNHLRELV